MTLRQAKIKATKAEHYRVFHQFNRAEHIYLDFEGKKYMRVCWRAITGFGWGRWEEIGTY